MNLINWLLQSILWVPIRVLFAYGGRLRVEGGEHLLHAVAESSRGVLLVSNHISQFDPVILAATLPFWSSLRPLYYVSLGNKHYQHLSLGRFIYGGLLFRLFGAYPVYRGRDNFELAFVHHIQLLGEGRTVSIFPEGVISKTGTMCEPRSGVAFLATRTRALVLPAAIEGAFGISFPDLLFRRARLTVRFGEPFRYEGEDACALVEHVARLQG